MGAVSVVGTATVYGSATTAVSLSPHANTAVGDMVVAIFGVGRDDGVRSGGSGFSTEVDLFDNRNNYSVTAYSKRMASASAITSYSFGNTNACDLQVALVTLRGQSVAAPIPSTGTWQASSNTTTATAPSLTASYTSTVLLAVFGADVQDANWSTPTGMTELADFPYNAAGSGDRVIQLGIFSEVVGVGATGVKTSAVSATPINNAVAMSLLIQPTLSTGSGLFFGTNI